MRKVQKKCGCLAEGTKILMADGSCKDIQEIRVGDIVSSRMGGSYSIVRNIWKGMENECLTIRTEGGLEITATKDHPVHMQEGFLKVGELKEDDRIMTIRGFEAVRFISKTEYEGIVYNLELEAKNRENNDGITMIANGIIVGDMNTQQKLLFEKSRSNQEN